MNIFLSKIPLSFVLLSLLIFSSLAMMEPGMPMREGYPGGYGGHGGGPVISDEDIEKFEIQAFFDFFDQYKKCSPSDQEKILKQLGLTADDMEKLHGEAEERSKKYTNKTSSLPGDLPYSGYQSPSVSSGQGKSEKENREELIWQDRMNQGTSVLRDAAKVTGTLLQKLTNEVIRLEALKHYSLLIADLETLHYYYNITVSFLTEIIEKKSSKKIEDADMKSIVGSAQLFINALQSLTQNLSAALTDEEEYDDLYTKYQIRKKTKENLVTTINELIQKAKNKKDIIDADDTLDEKTKKKLSMEITFSLENLFKDLAAAEDDFESKRANEIENKRKKKEFLMTNAKEIALLVADLVKEKKVITLMEDFLKKNFPKQYEEGKRREEINKSRKMEEARITTQRGTQGDVETEKLRTRNNYQPTGRDDYESNYGGNGGDYYNNRGYDASSPSYDQHREGENNEKEQSGASHGEGGSGSGGGTGAGVGRKEPDQKSSLRQGDTSNGGEIIKNPTPKDPAKSPDDRKEVRSKKDQDNKEQKEADEEKTARKEPGKDYPFIVAIRGYITKAFSLKKEENALKKKKPENEAPKKEQEVAQQEQADGQQQSSDNNSNQQSNNNPPQEAIEKSAEKKVERTQEIVAQEFAQAIANIKDTFKNMRESEIESHPKWTQLLNKFEESALFEKEQPDAEAQENALATVAGVALILSLENTPKEIKALKEDFDETIAAIDKEIQDKSKEKGTTLQERIQSIVNKRKETMQTRKIGNNEYNENVDSEELNAEEKEQRELDAAIAAFHSVWPERDYVEDSKL